MQQLLKRASVPGPFAIAAGLTIFTMLQAIFLTIPENSGYASYSVEVLGFWYNSFWDLLGFAMQMMLILILGHVLAYTGPVQKLTKGILQLCTDNAKAAFYITLFTLIAALVNWGLGLIFGAIMARQVYEYAGRKRFPVNYPLLGASGYSGLMIWHCGFSGSAPLTVADTGHFLEAQTGVIPVTETILSSMNLTVIFTLLIILPAFMYFLGKKATGTIPNQNEVASKSTVSIPESSRANQFAIFFGSLILLTAFLQGYQKGTDLETSVFEVLSLNYINYILLGLCLLLCGSFQAFSKATGEAIVSGTGIFLQFPLYAGIMGIMADSGLLVLLSDFFVSISTPVTFPLFSFLSGGLVNIFVPSGGGQWAVQGPLIIEASGELGIPFSKGVMALAYGDQITNMIQPFWALPLLGITGLKAAKLLPYTLQLMLIGSIVYIGALLLF
jgi:short-chain fatty acids transporter